jgi:trehalose 6-phosphate synthase/phosphatase
VVFTQVAVPSRERVEEYGTLKRQVDEAVGRINGRFAEEGWSPIRYIARSLDEESLARLYARADVALVTPLRDGMNLVAKEYVAAQTGEPGVLVLSELAGAAEELQEAVLVNPFDIDGMAEALHLALTMPPEERRSRMAALRDRVLARDTVAWAEGFLEAAECASRRARQTRPTPGEALARRLVPWLGARTHAALFLDYDGTITPIVEHPEEAVLDARTVEALELAAAAPHLDVAIVSGRALTDLRGRVPVAGVTLVGNHGFEIEGPGLHWTHPDAAAWRGALDVAARRLEDMQIPGTWVEHKGSTLSWHLRQMPDDARARAVRRGEAVLGKLGLKPVLGKAVLEARPPVDWNKGRALLHVLRARHGERWPLRLRAVYVGDDRTDEDAFLSLHGIGRSIRVGGPDADTAAEETLPDPEALVVLVRWLASGAWLGAGR